MKTLGYAERFGYGIPYARKALAENGNPAPRISNRTRICERCGKGGARMKTIAFFNNKSGVGKTTLVYHVSAMFAELGLRVLAVDLDPQANLTSMCVDDDEFEGLWPEGAHSCTLLGAVQPIIDGSGDITPLNRIRLPSIPG